MLVGIIHSAGSTRLPVGAIKYLRPGHKRAPRHPRNTATLIRHYERHHPTAYNRYVSPSIIALGDRYVAGYQFFGRFVSLVSIERSSRHHEDGFLGKLLETPALRTAEVAALALKQTFCGPFTPGEVFGDVDNERIVALPWDGPQLSLQGINIVEAAAYLPRVHEAIMAKRKAGQLPWPIQRLEIGLDDWVEEANPLRGEMRICLPNLMIVGGNFALIDQRLEESFERLFAAPLAEEEVAASAPRELAIVA